MTEEFGPYRLERLLGRGGMGEVHRAWDTRRGRTVAVKRLPAALAGDPEFQARFRRESALAAQLSEPHIIPIHDFGEIDGTQFIDMRLVEGSDLASAPLSLRKAEVPRPQAAAPHGGWLPPAPAAGWAPAPPRPPQPIPPRPGGMVVAFVLQLLSGAVFFLGAMIGFIGVDSTGAAAAVSGVALLATLYVVAGFAAFGGRRWARATLAALNGLFAVFCLVVIVYGLNDPTSTTGERAGGAAILLLLAAMAVACTVPMFTRPARRYAAARAR